MRGKCVSNQWKRKRKKEKTCSITGLLRCRWGQSGELIAWTLNWEVQSNCKIITNATNAINIDAILFELKSVNGMVLVNMSSSVSGFGFCWDSGQSFQLIQLRKIHQYLWQSTDKLAGVKSTVDSKKHTSSTHQHINTPTHQHTNTPTHQHTNTPTHQHINTSTPPTHDFTINQTSQATTIIENMSTTPLAAAIERKQEEVLQLQTMKEFTG